MKNVLLIAIACHSINIAYCASMGDLSHKPWPEAPQDQRDSVLAGVRMHLANPDATPEDSHNAWAAQKMADGWTYGEKKDVDAKTHPCLVPYEQLPAEQKAKDYIFRATVHALVAMPDVGAPADTTRPGFKAVRYIHANPEYVDRLYGTSLEFKTGQVRNVPEDLAFKFLRHGDLFEAAPDVVAEDPETAAQIKSALVEKQTLDQVQFEIQELRDNINALPTKAAIIDFAKMRFQQTLDPKAKLDDLRQTALSYVDLYGPKA